MSTRNRRREFSLLITTTDRIVIGAGTTDDEGLEGVLNGATRGLLAVTLPQDASAVRLTTEVRATRDAQWVLGPSLAEFHASDSIALRDLLGYAVRIKARAVMAVTARFAWELEG